ncbi:MAG: PIG-L family deacetylase [Actinobacteria bacterium]|nr:PIG-L family deacetylase [Actinomycetota bacterium]
MLAVFAHPDDAEISAGATLAGWTDEGRSVHLLVLTNGDRGSDDPGVSRVELARTRLKETEAAAALLGLASVAILDVHDGDLANTPEIRARIARRIREIRPGIVVTCDPTVWFFGDRYFNHADHRAAGATTLDAVFPGAGNPHFFSDQLGGELTTWSVPEVWLGWTLEPNHHQDVTGRIDRKIVALAVHRSQVEGNMLGFFEEWLPREAEKAGRAIGVQHAESFRVLNLT